MKQINVHVFVLMMLVFLVNAASANSKYPPIGVDMQISKVGERSYYAMGQPGMASDNEGFISNAGFVVTDEGVVVFDALGSPSLAWAMRQKIRALTDKPVTHVVVSHYHADHIYGLQVFKDEGAKIIAPQGVYEYLDSPAAPERLEERRLSLDPWVNDGTYLVRPDLVIDSVHRFNLGGVDFVLNYLGSAHSTGDLTLFVKQDRVLFSGDIIFEGRVPFVGDADTKLWLGTLKALETGGLKALVPGHGPAVDEPAKAIRLTRFYLARLRSVMGQAIEDLNDFASAFDEADWSDFEKLPAYDAAHRRNAYQVFLGMEAESLEAE